MHSYDYLLILAFLVLLLAPAPWLGRFFFIGLWRASAPG